LVFHERSLSPWSAAQKRSGGPKGTASSDEAAAIVWETSIGPTELIEHLPDSGEINAVI
jgi:hypothetical protein